MSDRGSILVVDDSPEMLQMLTKILSSEGYTVRPSDSGELALLSLKLSPDVDLALVDIRMPGLDGFDVCRRIKEREETQKIPIIFFSAATEIEERLLGLKLGAVDFVPKPFHPAELIARVRTHLELSRLRSHLETRVAEQTEELRQTNQNLTHEIANRRRIEDALRQRSEELSEALKRRGEFLAILSHELRNPLAPIHHSLEVLHRAPTNSVQSRRALDIITSQVGQLTRLCEDLLDSTRIAQGKINLRRQSVELSSLLNRCADSLRCLFETRGLTFDLALPPEEIISTVDPVRITQIVANLLQNATKFTPSGGRVSLALDLETDTQGAQHACIVVSDTGIGIAPESLSTIFKPFTQLDSRIARSQDGLGLGLSLVRGLVELHGGSIMAESDGAGRGATFVVRLPVDCVTAATSRTHPALSRATTNGWAELRMLSEANENPKAVTAVQSESDASDVTRKVRVLTVDDNVDAAQILKDVLELEGFEVEAVFDGASALKRSKTFHPHVVFCDLGLPDMDGFEVMRAMRADSELRDTYVVALSGYTTAEDEARSHAAGFNAHLAKPASVSALSSVIKDAERRRERGRAERQGDTAAP